MDLALTFQAPKLKYPLRDSEKESFLVRRLVLPSVWGEKHFKLTRAYARPGPLRLLPWQVDPVNAVYYYDVVIYCGCVQTGKSLIAEVALAWMIDNLPMNAMVCYAKSDTVKSVFDERIKPLIEEVPVIRQYWNGDPDRLTQKKITLNHLILRIASAETKSDIATYSAGYIYASEVAKYPKKDFDQIKALFGRQEGYKVLGTTKSVIESSPEEEGDPLHRLMYTKGVRNLEPYYPCPHCGMYQVLVDSQVKEKPNLNGEFDHNPQRIREDGAAWYECLYCHHEITETERTDMYNKVVWADKLEQIAPDGTIVNKVKSRTVSFQWNRFVDVSFTFSECLARFFEARQSVNPVSLKTYQNEDMGRFARTDTKSFSINWIMSKIAHYTQYGENAGYPNDVLVLTVGIDTQDAGFYYSIRGWGEGMESWLIKQDFISCSLKDDQYKDPDAVRVLIYKTLVDECPKRVDGKVLPISFGFIDRGGHRRNQVDYLCSRIRWLNGYVGTVNKSAPLISRSKEKAFYLGHTENLSKMVESYADTDQWHLPEDVTDDYCSQFLKQYWEEKIDRAGNTKVEYMHGGQDHYRDCENLNAGASIYLQLEKRLFGGKELEKLKGEPPESKIDLPEEQKIERVALNRPPVRGHVPPRINYLNRYHNF